MGIVVFVVLLMFSLVDRYFPSPTDSLAEDVATGDQLTVTLNKLGISEFFKIVIQVQNEGPAFLSDILMQKSYISYI